MFNIEKKKKDKDSKKMKDIYLAIYLNILMYCVTARFLNTG